MGVGFGDPILEGFIHVGKLREGFRPPCKKNPEGLCPSLKKKKKKTREGLYPPIQKWAGGV